MNDEKEIKRWCFYDWADSGYIVTAIAAILPVYFVKSLMPAEGLEVFGRVIDGQSIWGYLLSSVSFLSFLTLPFLGALSDYTASKKKFMIFFYIIGSCSATALFFLTPGSAWQAIINLFICHFCFFCAIVFYEGFLPQICSEDKIEQTSIRGASYGYIGGGLQFLLAVLIITFKKQLGLDIIMATRIGLGMSGVWWIIFGWYAISGFKERKAVLEHGGGYFDAVKGSFKSILDTIKLTKKRPEFMFFVLAYIFYIDGVQASIAITSVYATKTLKLGSNTIMAVFLMVQFVAFFGSFLFKWLSKTIGPKKSLIIAIVSYSINGLFFAIIPEKVPLYFFMIAFVIGICQGGIQPLSRAMYAKMIPEGDNAQYFGFYSIVTKFSAIWGPLIFAYINDVYGSARWGVIGVLSMLLIGLILFLFVDLDAAQKSKYR